MQNSEIIKILNKGGVGVLPTDTIYGMVGSVLNKKTVLKIYKVRKRNPKKPFIILISKISDLNIFGITNIPKKELSLVWPGKVSVILSLPKNVLNKFKYLHRGTKKLAFRFPKNKFLLNILKKTGPLVAPSANPEGETPAKNINEAKKYFRESVDFYFGKKTLKGQGSTILEYGDQKLKLVRVGAVSVNRLKSLKVLK